MLASSIIPEMYPLSAPLVRRFAQDRGFSSLSVPVDPVRPFTEQLGELQAELQLQWGPMLRELSDLREQAWQKIFPYIQRREHLSTETFLHLLKMSAPQQDEELSSTAVSRWRKRGFLFSEGRDCLNIETATAIIIMRMGDRKRERGFLPPGDYYKEPYMYAWRLDSPSSVARPCGLPLSEDIPNSAFLFTRWRALGLLHPEWYPYGELGSVRFTGVVEHNGKLLWNLSDEELHNWDPSIAPLGNHLSAAPKPQMRDALASLILLRLASQVFEQSPIV